MFPRPPIVTILGHVDHGKTTLLDTIRKSKLATKEIGGITQKIGAYEIDSGVKGYPTSKITFIDTPGHEAFSKLRMRGATVADLALLLIDAKESVMSQTVESIAHIKSASIPFIVVLNKVDLPDVQPEKVKNDLRKYEIIVEGKGGQVPVIEISAKQERGIKELLEGILLLSADLDLTYSVRHEPKAYIIETKKDKRGIVMSAIIKDGLMSVGDTVYAGHLQARIRSLWNDLGDSVKSVSPSTPFELTGFEELPEVGSELVTRPIVHKQLPVETQKKKIDLNSFLHPQKETKKLSLIIKTDSQGSLEAISNSIRANKMIQIVLLGVGSINKSDIFLAKITNSIIVGFGGEVSSEIRELAKQEKVIIKTFSIIYELLAELEEVAQLLKEKEVSERVLKGEAKILVTFIIEGEKVYGLKVLKGKINLKDTVEIYRQNTVIGKTNIVSLRHRARPISEVKKDQECGCIINPLLDIKIGDVLKSIS